MKFILIHSGSEKSIQHETLMRTIHILTYLSIRVNETNQCISIYVFLHLAHTVIKLQSVLTATKPAGRRACFPQSV